MKSSLDYISMCTKLISIYNAHKVIINGIQGLETHFMDLHILLIDLNNEYEESFTHLLPLLKEKEGQKNKLENLFVKFNQTLPLPRSVSAKAKKAGRKQENEEPVGINHLSHSEIIEQYISIMNRARNLNKKELHLLETQFTSFVLSIPLHHLLEEKMNDINLSENKTISDIDYLLTEQIDEHMLIFKTTAADLYALYQEARKQEEKKPLKRPKGRKGELAIA